MRRGGGIAYAVESEGRARNGLQLRAFVQSQEAGHLAGLQEVERVRPGRGGCPVAFHALQLLSPQAKGHHVQLHVLRLLLVEQHLNGQRRWSLMNRSAEGELVSGVFMWNPSTLSRDFMTFSFSFFFSFCLDFLQTSVSLTRRKAWILEITQNLIPSSPKTWFIHLHYDCSS